MLLTTGDHVYLTDFGLTERLAGDEEHTVTEGLLGTLNYMSSEQLRGESIDRRADIYALGCVAFQMLTGAKMCAPVSTPPRRVSEIRPALSTAFDAPVTRALSTDRADRHQSAGDFALEVASAAGEVDTPGAASSCKDNPPLGAGTHLPPVRWLMAPDIFESLARARTLRQRIGEAIAHAELPFASASVELGRTYS